MGRHSLDNMWSDLLHVLEHLLLPLALRDLSTQDRGRFLTRIRTFKPIRLLFLYDLYFNWVHRRIFGVGAGRLARSVFRMSRALLVYRATRAVSGLLTRQ